MKKKFAYKFLIIILIPVSIYSTTKENFIQSLQNWEIPENLSHPRLFHDIDTFEKLHRRYHGGWNEGVSYWGYGIGQALMFIDALYRVSQGKIDLYELPFLKVTANFGLYNRTPGGSSFNFSDCNPGPPKPWLMALLAAHFRDPYWQWSAKKDPGNTICDILFYDPGLQAIKPLQLSMAI